MFGPERPSRSLTAAPRSVFKAWKSTCRLQQRPRYVTVVKLTAAHHSTLLLFVFYSYAFLSKSRFLCIVAAFSRFSTHIIMGCTNTRAECDRGHWARAFPWLGCSNQTHSPARMYSSEKPRVRDRNVTLLRGVLETSNCSPGH